MQDCGEHSFVTSCIRDIVDESAPIVGSGANGGSLPSAEVVGVEETLRKWIDYGN